MPRPNDSLWSDINTLFEIGLEVYKIMAKGGGVRTTDRGTSVDKIADGVLLLSNNKEILLAVDKEIAQQTLSETALSRGLEKGEYLCYSGAATAIPLFELSKANEDIREYIVSEESLRATLCGNYPEYVKTHNMTAPPTAHIKGADAPMYLFLQKQLDLAADSTRSEVALFQEMHAHESDNSFERLPYEELELER